MAEGFYEESIKDGKYTVEVIAAEESTFRKSGKKCLNATFRIVGGDFDGEEIDEALPIFKVMAFARALEKSPTREEPFLASDMLGKCFSVDVRQEEYNGYMSPRVMPGGIVFIAKKPVVAEEKYKDDSPPF